MLTQKQLMIFGSLDPFNENTFNEIKASLDERSHSVLQNAISRFLAEDLITSRKIGTSKLYRLNHNNEKVHNYLSLYTQDILTDPAQKSINRVIQALDKKLLFYSLVVFGSYVDRTYKKGSDLDLAVFVPDETQKKDAKIALYSASNKTIIEIDPQVITEKELLEMLKADYENLGKEIVMKNLPIHNASIFYRLVLKGIENGFNPFIAKS